MTPFSRAGLSEFLGGATAEQAQLALSYVIWRTEAPDPRLVDEWVRRLQVGQDHEVPAEIPTGRAFPASLTRLTHSSKRFPHS